MAIVWKLLRAMPLDVFSLARRGGVMTLSAWSSKSSASSLEIETNVAGRVIRVLSRVGRQLGVGTGEC